MQIDAVSLADVLDRGLQAQSMLDDDSWRQRKAHLGRWPGTQQLAAAGGISQRTLLRILRGETRQVELDVAERLLAALPLPVCALSDVLHDRWADRVSPDCLHVEDEWGI